MGVAQTPRTDGVSSSGSKRPRSRLRPWLVALAVVVAVAFGVVWDSEYYSVKDLFFPRRFETVVPGALYRSGQIAGRIVEPVLAEHGVKVVVDLTELLPDSSDQAAEQRAVDRLGIEYHRFPLRGSGVGSDENYAAAVETIARARAAKRPVLVHCGAGDKRTGGVLAAYELLVDRATADRAVDELARCSKHNIASATVVEFLNGHLDVISAILRRDGFAVASSFPHLSRGG
jgi:protein tyrosine/serine phosphatase